MTDNEIVKALECCMSHKNCEENCPYFAWKNYNFDCVPKHTLDTINLINRQQAEIERLKAGIDDSFSNWIVLDERTKQRYAELYEEAKAVVRAEAIEEFAEKLRECVEYHTNDTGDFVPYVPCKDIDDLVDEMAGAEIEKQP